MLALPMMVFFVLLVVGVWMQDLEIKHGVMLGIGWLMGLMIFQQMGWSRQAYVAVEALLAIGLILKILGGNIRVR